ncbi:MAG: SgcJ/EcaC family oxidoreductase [Deltaproteobacteria bacterium]|nr:SgcJ/EcaC family oxidoreductase [Deltaproteobacteria bacterium]
MEQSVIKSLFEKWNDALKTCDPGEVVKLYKPSAILLPTMSNKVRHTPSEIKDYFVHFLSNKPEGKIIESNIRIFGDIAINSGLYSFKFSDETVTDARFTFVYEKTNDDWLIIEHHSSQMPEK